ncbi:hypothetical protein V5799_025410, partial [Amblyomma americanum]
MLRYPRYIYCAKLLYGDAGEFIIEEVLLNGRLCMSAVLQRVLERLQGSSTAEEVKQKFVDLVKTNFLCRVPYPDPNVEDTKIPTLVLREDDIHEIPEVRLYLLKQNSGEAPMEPPAKKIKTENLDGERQPDEKQYWRVNVDRFHQHL